jgi:hypothetical protein
MRLKFWRRRLLFVDALFLFVCVSTAVPASAATWAIIYSEGEKPNRVVFFADMEWVVDRSDPTTRFEAFKQLQAQKVARDQLDKRIALMTKQAEVNIVQIFENPDGPFARDMKVRFNCPANTVSVMSSLQIYHHNGRNDQGPTGGPFPATAPWVINQAQRLGCEEESWRAALKADRERGKGQDELMKLGMVLALNTTLHWKMYDFAWDNLWKDGRKRELSTDKTPEELEKIRLQTLAKLQEADKILDGSIAGLEMNIKGEDSERAFINGVAANFAKKPQLQRQTMSAQMGWIEADIVKFWGVPQQVRDVAGARVFVYRNEVDERVTQNTLDVRSGQIIGSTTTGLLRQCELSLFLKPGGKLPGLRLTDFQMRGENCNIDTLGKGRPK